MVTTFKTTECTEDHVIRTLNYKLSSARYHVENAFGILKARFQIFQRPLECAVEDIRFAIILTSAIFVLHNFLIDVKDETREEVLNVRLQVMRARQEEEEEIEDDEIVEENATRHALLRHMAYLLNLH